MKIKKFGLIALGFGLTSNLILAQTDRQLLIEPVQPRANEPIKISVTNSGCFSNFNIIQHPETEIQLTLGFWFNLPEQCRQENPNPPNFETTIGPLAAGTYNLSLVIHHGGFVLDVADAITFVVNEAGQVTTQISNGGINGLYHDPDAPHRYFYVLETDNNTLVVWNTFDEDGNQFWVYGVGDLFNEGSSIVADAYINTSNGIMTNGVADDHADSWGQIRVDLISCTEGFVSYQSDYPEFGSGEFSISRLAYSKQAGCENIE